MTPASSHSAQFQSQSKIRSAIATCTSHPGAIDVKWKGGTVTLSGPVADLEHAQLIQAVQALPGVTRVEDRLQPVTKSTIARGSSDALGFRAELFENRWSPLVRLVSAAAGAILELRALRGPKRGRLLYLGAGLGLLSRAITNRELTRLIGTVLNPAIRLSRTIEVSAPIDDVYEFWKTFANFARFMSYIRSVDVNETGGLRWVLVGPAGVPVEWDAELTALLPNQAIRWRSVPASRISNEGEVRFRELGPRKTEVDVSLVYAPPAGALGYAVAHFFGFDPRARIDEDLEVMRILIEQSSASRAA